MHITFTAAGPDKPGPLRSTVRHMFGNEDVERLLIPTMRYVLLVSIALCFLACSTQESDELSIVLVNNSIHSLIYLAWERESSNLVDPRDSLTVEHFDERLVSAGASAEVKDIEGGYSSGEDIRFFLYKVISEEAEKAPLAKILDVTNKEVEEHNYQVVVNNL